MSRSTRRKIAEARSLAPDAALLFQGLVRGEERPCFAVRLPHDAAAPVAFLNVCAHRNQPVVVSELQPFDGHGRLECRAHGAIYDPTTGVCVEGPCVGARLVPVLLVEEDGALWAVDDDEVDDSIYADEP